MNNNPNDQFNQPQNNMYQQPANPQMYNNYQQPAQQPMYNQYGPAPAPKKSSAKKIIFIILGIVLAIIVVAVVIVLLVFKTVSKDSNKLVCSTGKGGKVTLLYDENGLTGYSTLNYEIDFDKAKAQASEYGVNNYINSFKNTFEETYTDGKCTIELKDGGTQQ